ncbi:unnamed protein product [Toxocara canis]|uniref:Transposase n=1 Tax=Toxocara canis TaxID=6265 RepID=A0A183UTD4_TOXCA|nr:unnamed protein product [Toxocara canis]
MHLRHAFTGDFGVKSLLRHAVNANRFCYIAAFLPYFVDPHPNDRHLPRSSGFSAFLLGTYTQNAASASAPRRPLAMIASCIYGNSFICRLFNAYGKVIDRTLITGYCRS